jgi:hypothetical protein
MRVMVPLLRVAYSTVTFTMANHSAFTANLMTLSSEECPICEKPYGHEYIDAQGFSVNEGPVRNQCGHIVGATCARRQLNENGTCGVCGVQIRQREDESEQAWRKRIEEEVRS